ncbi:polysaccharide export outer membrane protein [Pedobacter westerhofensis]|uniref:Polysaccharide export outer membrane protein n=1 Tax=Pedobacter westerhofensis TaxID=425512 RepID=A0A521C8W0_9SPHI|nr:polysaccharide biosynthesis/export family protein [Pedobacter westerhofensis]SMO55846.1 polysaccharide export outer membrane protein [Pedobacter westerhofensis]
MDERNDPHENFYIKITKFATLFINPNRDLNQSLTMNTLNRSIILSKITVIFLVILLATSCVSSKKIAYFQDIQSVDQAKLENAAAFTEPTIQADDILSINVFTLNPQSGAIINQASSSPLLGGSANTAVAAQQITGFLVDKNGDIELALVGKIKVAGLTTYQARELVREKVGAIYKDPSVQLRFANFKVSVLGEVNSPSAYTLPNEKVTILDALSLAGDLTIFGKRENVLIVRDNNGKKEFARLNLNSSDIFNSPFYYLKQNDVVYVEPNKKKVSATNSAQLQTISVIASVLSVLVVAITQLK